MATRVHSKHLFLRIGMLFALVWGGYTTIKGLDSAAAVIEGTMSLVQTQMQLYHIGRYIAIDYSDSQELPRNVHELTALIRSHKEMSDHEITPDTGKDAWGRPFWLIYKQRGVMIISAGPDGKLKTDDDIRSLQSLRALGYDGPPSRRRSSPRRR